MKILAWAVTFLVLLPLALMAAQDIEGGRDHPLLSRMPGFHIDDYEEQEFDSYEFRGSEGEEIRVEGRRYYIDYGLAEGARTPSDLQIIRNHTNAITKVGGAILHTDSNNAYMKVVRGGVETWVHVRTYNQATSYSLNIVEKEAMVQEVTADAAAMASNIAETGKVAVYGIYFDFDKATLKPESEPALVEIGKLLNGNPELRLHVVGHTDNVGEFGYNMKLSSARAEAVVEALVSDHGIARERLRPAGVGPLAPAAPNATEEGRSKNRRVELVEQ